MKHRLEDFVVGATNRLAFSAATVVCGAAAAPFNPLFIHGACGVGKTHLLQGVCSTVTGQVRNGRPTRWRYVTAEQFTNQFIQALRAKKLNEFRARYRRLDLLAIDDVHFLSAKKATQEEFLHTFNDIQTAGRQIVMASDAHPRLVGELNEQLSSRFLAGMVVKIDLPDAATRLEILRRKAGAMKLTLASEVLEYIAAHVRSSVRELEGTLVKVAALAGLEGRAVTLPLVLEVLADHLVQADSAVTLGDIESAVAAYFGITPADIHSSRRTRTVSVARMVAMFLARRHTQMSYPEIRQAHGQEPFLCRAGRPADGTTARRRRGIEVDDASGNEVNAGRDAGGDPGGSDSLICRMAPALHPSRTGVRTEATASARTPLFNLVQYPKR